MTSLVLLVLLDGRNETGSYTGQQAERGLGRALSFFVGWGWNAMGSWGKIENRRKWKARYRLPVMERWI